LPPAANQPIIFTCFNFLEGLNQIKGLRLNVAAVETNIVSNLVARSYKMCISQFINSSRLQNSFISICGLIIFPCFIEYFSVDSTNSCTNMRTSLSCAHLYVCLFKALFSDPGQMIHLHSFIILFDQIFFDVVEGAKITAEKLCKNLEQHGILVMQESPVRSVETPNIPMNSSKKEKEKASHLIWFYVA
jgi:hypothetical protein